jgi:hypothetical protein
MENDIQYRPIETEFETNEIKFKQLKREGDVALYERTNKRGKCDGYEAIYITKSKGGICYGKTIEPYEVYPGDAMFGKNGYYCVTMEQAMGRFNELLVKQEARNKAKAEADRVFAETGVVQKQRGRPKKIA